MAASHRDSNTTINSQYEHSMPVMLAKLEKDLQESIQELLGMNQSANRLAEREELQEEVARNMSLLRTKMRMLRRWRNGSEEYNELQVHQLSAFISRSQIRIYEAKITQLLYHLAHIDELLGTEEGVDQVIVQLRQDIDCLLPVLQERLKSVDVETETVQCVLGFKEDLQEIQTMVLALRERVAASGRRVKKNLSSTEIVQRVQSLSSPSKYTTIEDNPLVNDLLRMVSKIRRLVTCFQNGYHEPMAGSIPCVDNDIDVLHRQLDKLQKWRNCERDFTKSDLEDMDLVVSAMKRHLRNGVSMDSLVMCEGHQECDKGCELSSTHRGSKSSSGGSQSSSCSMSSCSVEYVENKTVDNNSYEEDMLEERLI